MQRNPDGAPAFVTGRLAKIGQPLPRDAAAAARLLRPALPAVLTPFGVQAKDLVLHKVSVDESGASHVRYRQQANGLEVVGGELVVHVDATGTIFAINGTARAVAESPAGAASTSWDQAAARLARDPRFAALAISNHRDVYLRTEDGALYRAFEALVEGERGGAPARDKVYVDVRTGDVVAVHPQIHNAKNRQISTANNTNSRTGPLRRAEGQAPIGDAVVDGTYDTLGQTYDAYALFWGRDSFDHGGAAIPATVHYGIGVCNAFWDGSQFVFGDGAPGCGPLGLAVDVAAHEFTHAVTEHESNLVYSGESGGMNESMSDAFGAFVEAYVDGGATGALRLSAPTWQLAEDAADDPFRRMCDPASDGDSADLWFSGVGNLDVHYSSGVGNLAFCLLTTGGSHPRGKTPILVTGVGMDKAIRILYKAQRDILTSNANYAAVRTAMEQAAIQTGNDQATIDAVSCAWAAVGVGAAPATCGRRDIVFQNQDGTTAVWRMNGSTIASEHYPGPVTADWKFLGVGEFTGDGKSDLLWRNSNDGTLAIWAMNGGTKLGDGYPGVVGLEWSFEGIGDFDGGGSSDILWRHTSGAVAIWLMSNGVKIGEVHPGTRPSAFQIRALGDFNGDGVTDIAWRDTSGTVSMWMFRDGAVLSSGTVQNVGNDWQVASSGDFNDDGKSDILWRNTNDGTVAIWFMNGTSKAAGDAYPGAPGGDWVIQGTGDFDGDAKSDILWRNADGTVAIWFMNGGVITSQAWPRLLGNDWVIKGTGQLD